MSWRVYMMGKPNRVYSDCKAIISIVHVDIEISHYEDFIRVYNQGG